MAPRLGSSHPFVEHVCSDIALELQISSLKIVREFYDMKFLFKLTNGLVDRPAVLVYLMFRLPVRITRQYNSFVIGNYSLLYAENCPKTKMCKFANDRDIDV